MSRNPTGRSHVSSWEGTRQNDETDRAVRRTHGRIDGLQLPYALTYTVTGVLATGDDQALRHSPPSDLYLSKVRVQVPAATKPTGADIIVDVRVGEDSIFDSASGRPRIKDGEESGESKDFARGHGLSVQALMGLDFPQFTIRTDEVPLIDIDQVGSVAAGSNLTVELHGYMVPL